jgi:hypothetical protein
MKSDGETSQGSDRCACQFRSRCIQRSENDRSMTAPSNVHGPFALPGGRTIIALQNDLTQSDSTDRNVLLFGQAEFRSGRFLQQFQQCPSHPSPRQGSGQHQTLPCARHPDIEQPTPFRLFTSTRFLGHQHRTQATAIPQVETLHARRPVMPDKRSRRTTSRAISMV